jgi:hypothetical protein
MHSPTELASSSFLHSRALVSLSVEAHAEITRKSPVLRNDRWHWQGLAHVAVRGAAVQGVVGSYCVVTVISVVVWSHCCMCMQSCVQSVYLVLAAQDSVQPVLLTSTCFLHVYIRCERHCSELAKGCAAIPVAVIEHNSLCYGAPASACMHAQPISQCLAPVFVFLAHSAAAQHSDSSHIVHSCL